MSRMPTYLLCTALLLTLAPVALAQRGTGAPIGVASQPDRPDSVLLFGSLLEIKSGPCEATTGRGRTGTHLLLETANGKHLNIHLGPTNEIEFIADRLEIGEKIEVQAFRTNSMPDKHYVAQVLNVDDDPIHLRDKFLRPFWAGGRFTANGRGGSQWRTQRGGRGPGNGRCAGYGRGRGRGAGYGRGPRQGNARGHYFLDQNGDGMCDRFANLREYPSP